ncbi:MAG: hypothetical protein JXA50_01550 [Deltaproteobacteria bacterium]|nr:hypothetical protein [Deltaproteobacteria bacterium]
MRFATPKKTMGKKIPLVKLQLTPLIIETVKKSKNFTDREKKAIIDYYNHRLALRKAIGDDQFLIDPRGRDIQVPLKKKGE